MYSLQLDLFSWDIVKLGEAFQSLARLDFKGAKFIFEDILSQLPGHSSAKRGVAIVNHWEDVLKKMELLKEDEALVFFWENIKVYPFGNEGDKDIFRKALLGKLLSLMNDSLSVYIPPDLCRGYLLLQLGNYEKAENAFKSLLKKYPTNGRLQGYLGDALWMQGRTGDARLVYTRALLMSPYDILLEELKDEDLLEVIEDDGIEMAPIYGWLRGILPLVDVSDDLYQSVKHKEAVKVYAIFYQTEKARQVGRHEQMVARRIMLKKEAPECFNAYMENVSGLLL